MDRNAFIKLGLSLLTTEACLSGCASDDDATGASAGSGASPVTGGSTSGGTDNGAGTSGVSAGASTNGGSAGLGMAGASPTAECATDANLVQTSMESHDHLPLTAPITAAALNAGSPTEFALALEQNHIHTLDFTPDDLMQLRAGMAISKRSSSMMGHTHTYRIKCV